MILNPGCYQNPGAYKRCCGVPGTPTSRELDKKALGWGPGIYLCFKRLSLGFPGGSVVKNLPANAGDTGSIPDPG